MIKVAAISDIHIGAQHANVLKEQLENYFLNVLENEKPDLVVICGDLIDHKLSFNSTDSKLAIDLIEELSKKYPVRLLKGTRTHDLDQLNNFIYLENKEGVNFKLYNKMISEEIAGYKFLFMPEEYMEDYFEHYSDLLSDTYDIGFFHGTWNFAGYTNQLQESERPIKHAPLFKVKELTNVARMFVGGHIHTSQQYENVLYTGSFSRWCMGEEEDKGFYILEIDDNEINKTFYVNNLARKYVTLDVNQLIANEEMTLDQKINYIEEAKKNKDIYKLRIKFDSDGNDVDTTFIKDYFSKDSNVKVSVTNTTKEMENREEEKLTDEYSFIFKREYDMPTMISMYLKKHDDVDLDPKVIEELLLQDE